MDIEQQSIEDVGALASVCKELADFQWRKEFGRGRDAEELMARQVTQTQVTIIIRSGGRVSVDVNYLTRNPNLTQNYHRRFQRVPGSGYHQVAHSQGR